MRRLNRKWLLILLGTIAALTLGVHTLHGYQIKRQAVTLLQLADVNEQKGNWQQAVTYLKQYVVYRPEDTDALAKLGTVLGSQARRRIDRFQAMQYLEQVLRREPDRPDAHQLRERAADLAMGLGQYGNAEIHLRVLVAETPKDAARQHQLGRCYVQLGRNKEARDCLEKAVRLGPERIESYEVLAELLRQRLDRAEIADNYMDRMVAANKSSFQAYLSRARYRARNKLPKSDEDVAQARRLAPDDFDVLMASAEVAGNAGNFDEARKYLRRGLELHPKELRAYQMLVELEVRLGRLPDAIACLRQGAVQLPHDVSLLCNLASLEIEAGKLDDANTTINRLKKENARAAHLDFLEGRLLIQKKDWLTASKRLEKAQQGLAGEPALAKQAHYQLGQCYEQLGDRDRQLAAYRRAVTIDPLWVAARLKVAGSLMAAGRLDEAVTEYRNFTETKAPPAIAWLELARVLTAKNLRQSPEQRDWTEVNHALDQAEKVLPGSTEVAVLRAQVGIAQGRSDLAREVLNQARQKHPDQVEVWVALINLAEREGKPETIPDLLDQAQKHLGDSANVRLLRAQYWTDRRDPKARGFLAALLQDAGKFSPEDQSILQSGVAEAYARLGDTKAAEQLWTRLAAQPGHEDDLRTRIRLLDLALEAKDDARMQALLAEIRKIEGEEGTVWRFGEAARRLNLARKGDKSQLGSQLGTVRTLISEVATRRPAWSRVPLLRAQLAEVEELQEAAITEYRRAVDAGERQPAVVRRLIQLLYARKRYVDADLIVKKLQSEAAMSADLKRLAVEVSLRAHDESRALELAQQAVPSDSKDYRDFIWLGQVLGAVGPEQRARAETALRHAIELADNVPDPWVALVQFQARTRQLDRALTTIGEARRKLGVGKEPLAFAQCYELVDRKDLAEQEYQAALKQQPSDAMVLQGFAEFLLRNGRPQDALPHLQSLLTLTNKDQPADGAWARRELALVLAMQGDYQRLDEALRLVEQNLQLDPKNQDDLYAKAAVLGARPDRRAEAIRLLEEAGQRQQLSPDQQFLLAQFYENKNQWSKARSLMLSLLASDEARPVYLMHYIRSLLSRGESDREEARIWTERLARVEPDSFRTAELRATLLSAEGKKEEAATLLEAYVQSGKDVNLARVAVVADRLGLPAAAERMYREQLRRSKRPEAIVPLIDFLARQNRAAEALDLCEQAWKTCPAETAAAVSVAVVYRAKVTDQQRQRVTHWLDAAVQKNPNSAALAVTLATYRNLEGRFPDAEKIYRQILASNPLSTHAMNNLAWLLALNGVGGAEAAEALELINRAIQLDGPLPGRLDTRAIVLLSLGHFDAALTDLKQALELSPTPEMSFHLARTYHLMKDRRNAITALKKAKETGLKEASLHPLERPVYSKLVAELERR